MNQFDAVERATQDDAQWFEKHLGRTYRIRKHVPGELPVRRHKARPHYQDWTLVKQLAPGRRVRMFIAAPLGFVPCDTDDNIGELMDFALSHPNHRGTSPESTELVLRCFLPLSPATSVQ
jgi:hypothetical protein